MNFPENPDKLGRNSGRVTVYPGYTTLKPIIKAEERRGEDICRARVVSSLCKTILRSKAYFTSTLITWCTRITWCTFSCLAYCTRLMYFTFLGYSYLLGLLYLFGVLYFLGVLFLAWYTLLALYFTRLMYFTCMLCVLNSLKRQMTIGRFSKLSGLRARAFPLSPLCSPFPPPHSPFVHRFLQRKTHKNPRKYSLSRLYVNRPTYMADA